MLFGTQSLISTWVRPIMNLKKLQRSFYFISKLPLCGIRYGIYVCLYMHNTMQTQQQTQDQERREVKNATSSEKVIYLRKLQ